MWLVSLAIAMAPKMFGDPEAGLGIPGVIGVISGFYRDNVKEKNMETIIMGCTGLY